DSGSRIAACTPGIAITVDLVASLSSMGLLRFRRSSPSERQSCMQLGTRRTVNAVASELQLTKNNGTSRRTMHGCGTLNGSKGRIASESQNAHHGTDVEQDKETN